MDYDLIDWGAGAEGILTGQQGGGDDDADQDEVAHDGVALQPVAEYPQTVVLQTRPSLPSPTATSFKITAFYRTRRYTWFVMLRSNGKRSKNRSRKSRKQSRGVPDTRTKAKKGNLITNTLKMKAASAYQYVPE